MSVDQGQLEFRTDHKNVNCGSVFQSPLVNFFLLLVSWTDSAKDFEIQQAVLQQTREVPHAIRMVR